MLARLQRGWNKDLLEVFKNTERQLTISSPYFTDSGARFLVDNVSKAFRQNGKLRFITDLSPINIYQGSTDPNSFKQLFNSIGFVEVFHLPRLHAKVYIGDDSKAIVTSANLTAGGLFNNFEYGVLISSGETVTTIREDLIQYGNLGATLGLVEIEAYCSVSNEITALRQQMVSSPKRRIDQLLNNALTEANDELIRMRLSEGTLHAIFEKTIQYLLEKYGPLSTSALHVLIEEIHPDLCDNTVDRVINGKRFGKKWKHAARTAQQHLGKKGMAELIEGKWTLI